MVLDRAAINKLLNERGTTVAKLADRCGYEDSFLRRALKRGTAHPRTVLILSMALDVAVEDITKSPGAPPALPEHSRCVVIDRYAIQCGLAYADMTLDELSRDAHCAASVLVSRGWCERSIAHAIAVALGLPPEEIIIERE